eukprot:2871670-Amphidinium_carterae.1
MFSGLTSRTLPIFPMYTPSRRMYAPTSLEQHQSGIKSHCSCAPVDANPPAASVIIAIGKPS